LVLIERRKGLEKYGTKRRLPTSKRGNERQAKGVKKDQWLCAGGGHNVKGQQTNHGRVFSFAAHETGEICKLRLDEGEGGGYESGIKEEKRDFPIEKSRYEGAKLKGGKIYLIEQKSRGRIV